MRIKINPFRPKWSAVIFGSYLSGLVIYSLYISDEKCLRYIGRGGIKEDCSIDKKGALIHLGFIATLALLFLIVGISNILKKKTRDKDETQK